MPLHPHRLRVRQTQLLIVDVQPRLLPKIHEHELVLDRALRCVQAARVLGLPITISEQYTSALGGTTPALLEAAGGAPRYEKMTFSCWGAPELQQRLLDAERQSVLLVGIETHVCVLQTALDLLESGLRPVVLVDAVGSRFPRDRDVALDRMRSTGVELTTVESAVFELLERAGTDVFRRVLPILK